MRAAGLFLLSGLAAAGLFLASPIATAWWIKEAIQTNDAPYLERKIEWDTVRTSLRQSLLELAVPVPAGRAANATPGLWQRFKRSVGSRAVNRVVDDYVSPERLPQLFQVGRTYRGYVHGEAHLNLPLKERMADFWRRLVRAEFKSVRTFELEMVDRFDANRRYVGLLQLRGFEWKLAELHVRATETAAALASAEVEDEAETVSE